jgi:hypothetical protein
MPYAQGASRVRLSTDATIHDAGDSVFEVGFVQVVLQCT